MMIPADLFTSCLSPTDASTMVRLHEKLVGAAVGHYVEAFTSLDFLTHQDLGQSKATRLASPVPIGEARWGGLSDDTIRSRDQNAAYRVEWQGHTLHLVKAEWRLGYSESSYVWVIAASQEVARAYALDVARKTNEPEDTVLVFHGSCWNRSKEHWQAIQSASFDDLVLASAMKEQLRSDFRRFISARESYEAHGVAWRRGALFLGPPGNGKTHALRALLRELAIPALYVQSVKARYETEEANLRRVFDRARQLVPCALVLEDLDALVNAENRSFFLNQLDGFEKNVGLVVVATTNHPERIDAAILDRPSRFDRKYTFALPALDERRAYLLAWQKKLAERTGFREEDATALAERTETFSFAYLKELVMSSLLRKLESEAPFAEILESERELLASQRYTPPKSRPTLQESEGAESLAKMMAMFG